MTEDPDSVDVETRRRLTSLAAQAHARSAELAAGLESRRGQPAARGDLFVLPATADLPVEWAILDRGTDGRLLAVPADSGLPAGTADVSVPDNAPGGPLSLRCRYAVWLDAALFEPDLRSGTLAPEAVAEALDRIGQIENGTLKSSPLAEEVDADPEYADWLRDVPERARELASAARASNPRPSPGGFSSWGTAHRLAAVLALVSIGLALWVVKLQREVKELSGPIFNTPSGDIALGEDVRGIATVSVPRKADRVTLLFTVDPSIEPQDGYLEIVDRTGRLVWRSPRFRSDSERDFDLTLSRQHLPYGDYRVRFLPASGGPPLAEEALRIEPAE